MCKAGGVVVLGGEEPQTDKHVPQSAFACKLFLTTFSFGLYDPMVLLLGRTVPLKQMTSAAIL